MSTPKAIIISSIIIGACLLMVKTEYKFETISLGMSGKVAIVNKATGATHLCTLRLTPAVPGVGAEEYLDCGR